MSRTYVIRKFKILWFQKEARYWALKLLTDVDMPPLMPNEDKNFGVSLVLKLDFGKWWRHVKTIYNSPSMYSCVRLVLGKFELTNQDSWSEGEKNFTAQTSMYVNRKGIEIRQLFSLTMALAFYQKGVYNSKNQITLWRAKNIKHVSELLIWTHNWVASVLYDN